MSPFRLTARPSILRWRSMPGMNRASWNTILTCERSARGDAHAVKQYIDHGLALNARDESRELEHDTDL